MILKFLNTWAISRRSWLLLFLSAAALELAALFFQYGLQLNPCVMCIYQRVAVVGLAIAGIIGMLAPAYRPLRIMAALIWGVSAIWGLKIAMALNDLQQHPSPFATCSFTPEFPAWLPLHEWLPEMFMPTGMCSEIPWRFMGITMAQWMIVAFAVYVLMLALFATAIVRKKA
ncbi:disulfide bond formation protein DsbB [Shewanella sp. YIC-542]|uniref:disulfide bond formation protein DsbB n=1 Tax=Shewanella mytili TaxID=3377111 RepID=UPI00398E925D